MKRLPKLVYTSFGKHQIWLLYIILCISSQHMNDTLPRSDTEQDNFPQTDIVRGKQCQLPPLPVCGFVPYHLGHAAISPKWGAAELVRLSQLGVDMQWSGSVLPVPTGWLQLDLLLAMVLLKKALQWALQNILGKLCSTCCRLQMTAVTSLFVTLETCDLTCVVLHSAGCWFFVFVCWIVA